MLNHASALAHNTTEHQGMGPLARVLRPCSIEVTPKTALQCPSLANLLPPGTRVYIAHIQGTPIADMVATAKRLTQEGFAVMPHFPARLIHDAHELAQWIDRYQQEAQVQEALLLGGGASEPVGVFEDSMQLVETGLFAGFKRLHFAAHPENNRDIDPDGSGQRQLAALRWKQAFAQQSAAEVALVTQFCFDAEAVNAWLGGLRAQHIELPVHLGVAGPANLKTLLHYALTCGVGPSLQVIQRRAKDITKLLLPYEPTEFLKHWVQLPNASAVDQIHFFPLGGLKATAEWLERHTRNNNDRLNQT